MIYFSKKATKKRNVLEYILTQNDVLYVFQRLIGTSQYWKVARSDIFAKVKQLGPFHIFFTLSCVEVRWPEVSISILKSLGHELLSRVSCQRMEAKLQFLVGAFRSKMQTIVLNFLGQRSDRFYKLASTNCHTNVASASDFLRFGKQKHAGSSPALHEKFFYAGYFFGFVRLFLAKFLNVSKGSLFFLFSILQKNGCSKKLPKGPLFTFFGTMRLTGDQRKIGKISDFSIFSSCGYCRRDT